MDRATGETGWTVATTAKEADEALLRWADAQCTRPDANPFEPRWKDPGLLTKEKKKLQDELRQLRRKELRQRDTVEAQKQIERLRDKGALFVLSHSGGKDSQTMAIKVHRLVPDEQIIWVHAPLKGVEWAGGIEQVKRYKPRGVPLLFADAIDLDEQEKWLLEWVVRRGMWPSKGARWCTSDFKRGPIRREIRHYADANGYSIIVDAQGLRAQESSDRATRAAFEPLASEHGKKSRELGVEREWYSWLPIKWDSTQEVFETIDGAGQLPMWTYLEGMTRSSCAFCIMASLQDLQRAAELSPDVYAAYVAVEKHIGHTIQTRRGTREERQAYAEEHGLGRRWADKPGSVIPRPLEEVVGIRADSKLVRKYLRRIETSGKLRESPVAGEKAYRRGRRREISKHALRLLREDPEFGQMEIGVRISGPGRVRNVETYMTKSPTDPLDVPWADEFFADVTEAFSEPEIVLLVSPETKTLLRRLETAPRRQKYFERVTRAEIDPVVDPALVDEGWYRDMRTGRGVVVEDDGSWFRETPHPAGAFTIGELVRLESLMWKDADRMAEHAERLSDAARHAAVSWVEGADHLELRLVAMRIQPESSEEAQKLKREILELL